MQTREAFAFSFPLLLLLWFVVHLLVGLHSHSQLLLFLCLVFFFLIDYVFKLFIFFIDLEIMQPCRGNFIASLTLNNCSRQKEIMMKGLVENNTRHSGTDTNEG